MTSTFVSTAWSEQSPSRPTSPVTGDIGGDDCMPSVRAASFESNASVNGRLATLASAPDGQRDSSGEIQTSTSDMGAGPVADSVLHHIDLWEREVASNSPGQRYMVILAHTMALWVLPILLASAWIATPLDPNGLDDGTVTARYLIFALVWHPVYVAITILTGLELLAAVSPAPGKFSRLAIASLFGLLDAIIMLIVGLWIIDVADPAANDGGAAADVIIADLNDGGGGSSDGGGGGGGGGGDGGTDTALASALEAATTQSDEATLVKWVSIAVMMALAGLLLVLVAAYQVRVARRKRLPRWLHPRDDYVMLLRERKNLRERGPGREPRYAAGATGVTNLGMMVHRDRHGRGTLPRTPVDRVLGASLDGGGSGNNNGEDDGVNDETPAPPIRAQRTPLPGAATVIDLGDIMTNPDQQFENAGKFPEARGKKKSLNSDKLFLHNPHHHQGPIAHAAMHSVSSNGKIETVGAGADTSTIHRSTSSLLPVGVEVGRGAARIATEPCRPMRAASKAPSIPEDADHDDERLRREIKVTAGMVGNLVLLLVSFLYCQVFSNFYFANASDDGRLQVVLSFLFGWPLFFIGNLQKFILGYVERLSTHTQRSAFPAIVCGVEAFYQVFYKFLFVSITSWWVFAVFIGVNLTVQSLQYPVRCSSLWIRLRERVNVYAERQRSGALRFLLIAFGESGTMSAPEYRNLIVAESFFVAMSQRIAIVVFAATLFFLRFSWNRYVYPFGPLDISEDRFVDISRILLALFICEWTASSVIHIVLLHPALGGLDSIRIGGGQMVAARSSTLCILLVTHIIMDTALFRFRYEFAGFP
jgi:hypothetical protein